MTKWIVEPEGRNLLTRMNKNFVTAITTIFFILFVAPCSFCGTTTYQGFKLLREADCKPMERASLVSLPPEWQKYAGFVKACNLKETATSVTNVSVVSIWVNDYYETNFPKGPHKWEHFPLPLIIDSNLQKIGQLPEIYPLDDITSPDIYYGKWQNGIPKEIKVDVRNPAEGGNYYYKPLIWNERLRFYQIEDMGIIDGRRSK